ncbi:MAG TPA: flavin reductase family protein [Acidimicrobiales bacterium]|nr:flavin reductase family protein [Acidimicrobiales bacterium]
MSSGVDKGQFRAVLGHFASGVVLVTGLHEGRPAGFTCQSFFSLSLDPPLVALAPGKSSTSWPRVSHSKSICVNILAADQEGLAWTFSQSGTDKFAGVGWSPAANGAPRLHGALAWLDCTVEDVHEAGDHWLVTARVTELESNEGQPLLFYRGGFGGFSP